MSMFITKSAGIFAPSHVRTIYNRCRIGNRDWVGFGHNGCANYKDDAHFPFPAVRFKENTRDICALREKEKGDWKCLCCEEKKALYRSSFCQTFSEFQHPTGLWKLVLGSILIGTSFTFWVLMFHHYYVFEPLPASLAKEAQKAQLRRMLELRVNPIDGISSKWDYDNDRWKPGCEPFLHRPSACSILGYIVAYHQARQTYSEKIYSSNQSASANTKANDANSPKEAPTSWQVVRDHPADIYASAGSCRHTPLTPEYNMKCAIAIVLALVGMVAANPVASLGYGHGYGSHLLLPSAVSVSSSIVNHGLSIPKVAVAPIVVPTIVKAPVVTSLGWGGYGGYGLGGHGNYGLGGHGGHGLGGHGGYSWGGHGGYGLGGYGGHGLGGHGGYSWGGYGGHGLGGYGGHAWGGHGGYGLGGLGWGGYGLGWGGKGLH